MTTTTTTTTTTTEEPPIMDEDEVNIIDYAISVTNMRKRSILIVKFLIKLMDDGGSSKSFDSFINKGVIFIITTGACLQVKFTKIKKIISKFIDFDRHINELYVR